MLREAGVLPLLTELTTGQEASLRPQACMCLSFIASSEVSARELMTCGVIQSAVSLVQEGEQERGAGVLPPAWRAASVMTLRALASHPVQHPRPHAPFSFGHKVDGSSSVGFPLSPP
jgi:hypothetical protein